MTPPEPEPRRARLARAEALLDRWLDLFEAALEDARPDPARTSELANVFTILKRVHEIENLMHRAAAARGEADETPRFQPDPDVFGVGIPCDDEDGAG